VYLKKIEMRGFKTFADRSEIDLRPGITAIVGPNGTGKSNVTDAIIWALGEQSNRALRTEGSQDVIFAGSENRRPLGMAEVSITVDNTDGRMPTDFSEIVVARRLFRSGDSEYLLNRAPARLRDIRELFMDTGVGPGAYSVVGQGEIDAILSIRSEDRRELIEEVAGIRKYRVRRDEATRKLQATDANMTRVADIVAELSSQRQPLEQEAEIARQYNELSEELRHLELTLLAVDYQRRRNRLGRVANEVDITKADLQGSRNQLSQLESAYERVQFDLAKLSDEVDRLRDEAQRAERELDQAKQSQALAEERVRAAVARQSDLADALEDHRARCEELAAQVEATTLELEDTQEQVRAAEERRAHFQDQLQEQEAALREKQAVVRQLENERAQALERTRTLEKESQTFLGLETDLAERHERLTRQAEATATRQAEIASALEGVVRRREELALTVARSQERLQASRAQLAGATRLLQEQRAKCNTLSAAVTAAEARQKLLQELEEAREGFSDGVVAVLKAAGEGHISGVRGIVADLLSVPDRFARAIEAAVGDALQWVVCDTEEQAAAGAAYVLENRLGRVTFVPLSADSAPEAALAPEPGLPENIGAALRIVRFEPRYAGLITGLLRDVAIVKDLPTALHMRRQLAPRMRLVTLSGEILEPGGAVTAGGEEGAGTQAFLRRRELEQLSGEMETLRHSLADMWRVEEDLDGRCDRLADEIHLVEEELSGLRSDQTAAESSAAHLADQQKAAQQAAAELEEEAGTLDERLAQTRERRERAGQQSEHFAARAEELAGQIEGAQSSGVAPEQVEEVRRQQVNAQVQAAQLAEKARSTADLVQRYSGELKRSRAQIEAAEKELEAARQTEEALRKKLAQPGVDLDALALAAEQARTQVSHGAGEVSKLREKSAELDAMRGRINQVVQEQTDRIHRSELALAREEAQLEGIVERLKDTYGLTPEEAFEARDEEVSERVILQQANRLREQIRKLGPVNISAIDECDRLRAREEFLVGQLEDLQTAKDDLLQVIREIDDAATAEFVTAFERLREEFRVMFQRLFGGGETELRLTNPETPLESGVDVVVQVPGKRAQNLLLLSGGERALTALALMFAMLRVKPTPFCVMDEIDAALDEANVGRFVEVLTEFARQSQFIIVTHNPHTIKAADVLFGVTMQDAGVSKLIKLELREWEDFVADAEENVARPREPRGGSRVLPTTT